MPLQVPEDLILPDEMIKGLLSSDLFIREKAIRQRDSLVTKYLRTGLTHSICPNHGKLSIYNFLLAKAKGKWYVVKYCNKCKYDRTPEHVKKKKRTYNRIVCKSYRDKSTKSLKDYYVRRLLISEGYNKEEITEQLIKEKREKVKLHRILKSNTTAKSRKRICDSQSLKRAIAALSDSYVKSRIRSSVGYKGEEITEKMMEEKRESILLYRETRENNKRLVIKHKKRKKYNS